jgi:hypothetical protein
VISSGRNTFFMGLLMSLSVLDLASAGLFVKETLIYSVFVVPAKAGTQLNQGTGSALSRG